MSSVSGRVPGSSSSTARSRPDGSPGTRRSRSPTASSSSSPPGPATRRTRLSTRSTSRQQAEELAALLEPGDHLAAHSYGAVVSLLAAAGAPLASLTVVEPPAFGVARGNPAVEEFLAHFEAGAPKDARGYLEFFLPLVGSSLNLRDPLPPAIEAGARAAIAERSPDQAVIPLDELAAAPFPKLVVSGGHSAAFDAVCDVLEQRLGAQRAVLPGAGHSIPRLGEPFNALLEAFVSR